MRAGGDVPRPGAGQLPVAGHRRRRDQLARRQVEDNHPRPHFRSSHPHLGRLAHRQHPVSEGLGRRRHPFREEQVATQDDSQFLAERITGGIVGRGLPLGVG